MKYAHVAQGKVTATFDVPSGSDIGELYHPDYAAGCVPCTPDVRYGWTYDGDTFSPPVTPAPTPDDLKAIAANLRWQRETKGITINGAQVATDDRSQRLILGLRVKADANPDFSTRFKGEDGQWFDVNTETIIAISDAVFSHVDAAFALEETVVERINDGLITTREGVEAAFS